MTRLFLLFLLYAGSCNTFSKRLSNEELEDKAYALTQKEEYLAAINHYNELIKRDSLNGTYYYSRGYSYSKLMEDDRAIMDFLKSAKLNYKVVDSYFNAGLMYSFTRDSIALIYFEKAIKLDPNAKDIRVERRKCLERLKISSE